VELAVNPSSNVRPYTHLINLVAQRSSLLLGGTASGSQEYMDWVHSLEQDFGVHIEVRTILGPDNRPSAIDGTIRKGTSRGAIDSGAGDSGCIPPDCQLAFTVDGDETRCCVRYC